VTKERFEQLFVEFLREYNSDPSLSVSSQENLFNLGLLDSFGLVGLVDHLERALACSKIPQGGLEVFFTIDRAYDAYVALLAAE
jgi:hypothetical protein